MSEGEKKAPKKEEKKAPQLQFIQFDFPKTDSKWFLPKRFKPLKALGHGAFGQVMLCLDTTTNVKVAIKRVLGVFNSWEDGLGEIREIKAMMHCKHPKVIAMKELLPPYSLQENGVILDREFDDIYMVMDAKSSDIMKLIETHRGRLGIDHIAWIMFQVLEGIAYLHGCEIVHRDLKPENLLIDENLQLTIIDLGLAREINVDDPSALSEYVMTRWYRAPEIMMYPTKGYTFSVDVWSCGCLLAELLTGDPLFPESNEWEMLLKIKKIVPDPDNYISQEYKVSNPPTSLAQHFPNLDAKALDLMEKLLTLDPDKRIKAKEALNHPLFARFQEYRSQSGPPTKFVFKSPPSVSREEEIDVLRDLVWECIHHYNPDTMPAHRSDDSSA